jgi:hypothetical protein
MHDRRSPVDADDDVPPNLPAKKSAGALFRDEARERLGSSPKDSQELQDSSKR